VGCVEIPRIQSFTHVLGGEYRYLPPDEPELSFGDYTPGRYAWILADVKLLPEPVPARGALGLWEWVPLS